MNASTPDHVSRLDRAIMALHDLGSRDNATAKSVISAMLKEGFTLPEIEAAASEMQGGPELARRAGR